MTPEAIVQALDRVAQEPDATVDHGRIAALTEAIDRAAAGLTPDQARAIHGAMDGLVSRLSLQQAHVRTQLAGIANQGRAARGYGRPLEANRFLRGQRVNRGA